MSKHIELKRLESRAWACTVTTDGVARDLTNCYLVMTAKSNLTHTDGQALFQLNIGDGITITDTTGGKFDLTIHSTATTNVTKSGKNEKYYYDIRIQLPSGNIKVMEQGEFVVLPNITDVMS